MDFFLHLPAKIEERLKTEMSYGSMTEEEASAKLIKPVKDESVALNIIPDSDFFPHNPFSETFDPAFWEAV